MTFHLGSLNQASQPPHWQNWRVLAATSRRGPNKVPQVEQLRCCSRCHGTHFGNQRRTSSILLLRCTEMEFDLTLCLLRSTFRSVHSRALRRKTLQLGLFNTIAIHLVVVAARKAGDSPGCTIDSNEWTTTRAVAPK